MARNGYLVQRSVTVEIPMAVAHPTIEQINKYAETLPGLPESGMHVRTAFENNRWLIHYQWTTTLDVLG